MLHDKYRKKYRVPAGSSRLRQQIALEAARRLVHDFGAGTEAENPTNSSPEDSAWLDAVTTSELYVIKRKAAAVLGHRVRQGDLPTDDEVRDHVLTLIRSGSASPDERSPIHDEERIAEESIPAMADHLDRFTIYKLRLQPLESIKQNPKYHPEGDALFHSLQVFELAREERPYDEEFLLAALLHDVGKGISSEDHVGAAVEALRGAVTTRTLWLIEHHMDLLKERKRPLDNRTRRILEASEYLEDLRLLRILDEAGRVPGQPVGTLDEALEYLQGLESEAYLSEPQLPS